MPTQLWEFVTERFKTYRCCCLRALRTRISAFDLNGLIECLMNFGDRIMGQADVHQWVNTSFSVAVRSRRRCWDVYEMRIASWMRPWTKTARQVCAALRLQVLIFDRWQVLLMDGLCRLVNLIGGRANQSTARPTWRSYTSDAKEYKACKKWGAQFFFHDSVPLTSWFTNLIIVERHSS